MRLLSFQGISKNFNGQMLFSALDGSIYAGETAFLRGASGTGKSTLLRILSRLIPADSGLLYYKDTEAKNIAPATWRRHIQYLPQKSALFDGTVEDNLRLPFSLNAVKPDLTYSRTEAVQLMEALDLGEDLLSHSAHSLSGGESARLCLVRALLLQPSMLLLDEPSASLDENRRARMMALLKQWREEQPERALLIISHNETDQQGLPADRIIELKSPN